MFVTQMSQQVHSFSVKSVWPKVDFLARYEQNGESFPYQINLHDAEATPEKAEDAVAAMIGVAHAT
jgi:hypothetical protein